MRFLSIDPGSHQCGVVLWADEQPIKTWLLDGGRSPLASNRIKRVLDGLSVIQRDYGRDVAEVAIEQVHGYEDNRPAPQLQALIEDIKQWAKKQRMAVFVYHPSTVIAMVRLRGIRTESTKRSVLLGVTALGAENGWAISYDNDQNIIDALATGWCHIVKRKEATLLRAAQQQLWPDESVDREV